MKLETKRSTLTLQALLTSLAMASFSCATAPPPRPEYVTSNQDSRWKTSGAPLFPSREAVKDCFASVYGNRFAGFRPCEGKATAVLPPGVGVQVLEKFDEDAIVKVKVLDGPQLGTIGFLHENWITPSPWRKR